MADPTPAEQERARAIIGTCAMQQPGCQPRADKPGGWCLKCNWLWPIATAFTEQRERLLDALDRRADAITFTKQIGSFGVTAIMKREIAAIRRGDA